MSYDAPRATTNATPPKPAMSEMPPGTRADRRRALAAAIRKFDYAKSGFIDRAIYAPFVPAERHPPFTVAEIMGRAVQRRDMRRMIENIQTERLEAVKIGDRERRQKIRAARREVYLAGCAKPQPWKYAHSSGHREAATLPMAA